MILELVVAGGFVALGIFLLLEQRDSCRVRIDTMGDGPDLEADDKAAEAVIEDLKKTGPVEVAEEES